MANSGSGFMGITLARRVEFSLQAESLRFLVSDFDMHSEERGGKCLCLRVGHQRYGAAPAEAFVQQKIECAKIRQLKSFDFTQTYSAKMFLDPRGCHFANQQGIEIVTQCDQADVSGVALITGARMSELC